MGSRVLSSLRSSLDRAANWLLARPGRGFAWLVGLHMLLWWLVLVVSQFNLPLDVIEIYAAGLDPAWALHKLPPLTNWLAWLFDRLGGGWQPVAQLQFPLAMGLAYWAIWRLGLEFFPPARALLAVLLLEAVGHLTFAASLFNHNTLQVPLWGLTALVFWLALQRDRLWLWALAGLLAALALLAKYFAIYLLTALLLYLLLEPGARRAWRRPGPYVTALVGLALLAPHLHSVAVDYEWQPFHYALLRAVDADSWSDHLTAPLGWLLAQVAGTWGALLALALLLRGRGPAVLPAAELAPSARRFLVTLALGPLALCLLSSAVTGSRFIDLWGMPLWVFLPLGAFALWPRPLAQTGLRRAVGLSLVLGAGAMLLHLATPLAPLVMKRPPRELFDGPLLAERATEAWRAAVPGEAQPAYLVGSYWLTGNVAYYGPWPDSRVLVNAFWANHPAVDPQRLRQEGALLLWSVDEEYVAEPDWLPRLLRRAKVPAPEASAEVPIPWLLWGNLPPYRVRFAVIPPAPP